MIQEEAILAALAYHDIFDYPLTLEEIHRYLIKRTSLKSVRACLGTLRLEKKIGTSRDFYFLKGRSSITAVRVKRRSFSRAKLKRARVYSKLLTLIPTIKLVAISGALAMENSHKKDDIDLVIVTSKHALWTTRFLANVLLLPVKRDPKSKKIANRVCLNLFLDEKDLKIKPQNLYTAHEICQLKPLFDRNKTYSRLIKSNQWVLKYLPNWQKASIVESRSSMVKASRGALNFSLFTAHLSPVETFLKNFQLWYMRSKISTEKVGETQLFFHPQNVQEWVLKEYQRRLKRLKILPVDN